jgi:hypothetical protein
MPYRPRKLIDQNTPQGWQVRISINLYELQDDPNNKIKTIEKILTRVFPNYTIDSTTNRQGKDVDLRGKGVCIDLPDTEQALSISNNDYKTMLLTLWSELQKAGIPLMYMDVPNISETTKK